MAFTMKQGDTLPNLVATLTSGPSAVSQTAVDLTTATGVVLILRPEGAVTAGTRLTAAITNAAGGQVTYDWQAGDTDDVGTFDCEWEVAFGAEKQTFPSDSYFQIIIVDDLD
jgi:hypothetical protein